MHTASGGSDRRALRREPLGNADPVHGVHPVEERRGLARLVGLQRADEVAAKCEARERLEMRARFLHVVFAEVGEPRGEGRFHALDRLRLADADQGD